HHSSSLLLKPPATTDTPTLSLHDALPICRGRGRGPEEDLQKSHLERGDRPGRHHFGQRRRRDRPFPRRRDEKSRQRGRHHGRRRSEEHTSELQSLTNLVCRLLLEKKKPKH